MLNWIKNLFVGTPAPTPTIDTKVEAANAVPYKVETPVIAPAVEAVVIVPQAVAPVAVVEAVVPAAVVEPVTTTTPKAPAKPKKAAVKKAAPKTASTKPATRGRKPKAGV